MDILVRLREQLVMSKFCNRRELYQEGEQQRMDAADEIERLRGVCKQLFDLGNDGAGIKDAKWTGAHYIDAGQLKRVWEAARDVLKSTQG